MAKKQHNWPRIILQWGTLAALVFFLTGLASKLFGSDPADPEALCPMGGLQALATFFVKGSLPCSMSSAQILMGIALAAAVILFSKLFCGYLCPVGTIEDLLTRIRKALGIRTEGPKAGSAFDAVLRIVKYVLLFVVFYFSVSASELFCKKLDPYYATATAFKGEIVLWMALTTVGIVLLCGLFIKRFWCRYICPLAAGRCRRTAGLVVALGCRVPAGLGAGGVQTGFPPANAACGKRGQPLHPLRPLQQGLPVRHRPFCPQRSHYFGGLHPLRRMRGRLQRKRPLHRPCTESRLQEVAALVAGPHCSGPGGTRPPFPQQL